MKIIYLHQYFNTPEMKGGTRSFEMGRRMVSAGHQVHIVTTKCHGGPPFHKNWYTTNEAGMTVHWLDNPYSNKMPFKKRLYAFSRFAWKALHKVAKLDGDIIFATSTPLTIAIPAIYASKKNRIPMVFEVRDLWPEGPIAVGALRNPIAVYGARWLEKKAYFNSSQIIALSPGMKEGITSTGYPSDLVSVIPNSCDTELFSVPAYTGANFLKKNPYLSTGPLLTYTGTLGMINGLGYLVEIAKEMKSIDSSIRFLIVGDGYEKEKIRNRAAEVGVLEKNLWMIPALPKREIPAILSASAMSISFVVDMPHKKNNCANKVFDAFAAGKPLLINHGGWIADILTQSGAGLVIPALNPKAAAKQIAETVRNDEFMEKAHCASLQLGAMYDRDKLANELIAILEMAANT